MRACPNCGDPLSIHGVCGSCNYGRSKPKAELPPRPETHRMTPEAKAAYESTAPRSRDLTEQQWYNVCRFWPTVAKRCSRPMVKVGPDHPLHATSRLGPLLKHRVDPEANAEREAIQAE